MRKSRRSRIASINVIPYLDVMLVLLVIFMATAPLLTLGKLQLPKVGDATEGTAGFRIIYNIGEGRPFIISDPSRGSESEAPLDFDGLKAELYLKCLSTEGEPNRHLRSIVIAADYNRFYGEVMELMNDIEDAGCEGEVSVLVEPRDAEK